MEFRFFANIVTYTFENGVHIVGLADHDPPSSYVILQRETDDDEQDKALGLDTYYMEVGEDGVAGYGGVTSVSLQGKMLNIELSRDVAWTEGLALVTIVVHATDSLGQLKRGLTEVFAGEATQLRFN
ncbi:MULTISPECIES: Imm10 family immunity protein [Burkholderia]|uniref:Imm10 family immunity protein n=1 Tax=Burkholderia TaxID=32008 RepID=UPI0003FEF3B3|nr:MULTISPECIES: Imm10 family immunity protein [Burkholderia]